MTAIRITRIGDVQRAALDLYVLDPAHEPVDGPAPFRLEGSVLVTTDREATFRRIINAANDADSDGDREFRDALTTLTKRILRA